MLQVVAGQHKSSQYALSFNAFGRLTLLALDQGQWSVYILLCGEVMARRRLVVVRNHQPENPSPPVATIPVTLISWDEFVKPTVAYLASHYCFIWLPPWMADSFGCAGIAQDALTIRRFASIHDFHPGKLHPSALTNLHYLLMGHITADASIHNMRETCEIRLQVQFALNPKEQI